MERGFLIFKGKCSVTLSKQINGLVGGIFWGVVVICFVSVDPCGTKESKE